MDAEYRIHPALFQIQLFNKPFLAQVVQGYARRRPAVMVHRSKSVANPAQILAQACVPNSAESDPGGGISDAKATAPTQWLTLIVPAAEVV